MAYRHVVALGSSFAAGPGIPPIVDAAAGRSGRNYAHLLAEALGAELTDLTVSGATTATILDQPQRLPRKTFPPQLAGVPADADLVTVTAGGNDLQYVGTLMRLAWANRFRARWWSRPLGNVLARRPVPVVDPDVAVDGLRRVVEAVRSRAPEARVLLVDYLMILEEKTPLGPDAPFTESERKALRALGRRVSGAFAVAAQATGAELVRASVLSAGHGVGSPEPWVNGFIGSRRGAGSAFHPNAAGMRAVADELVRTLSV